MSHEPTVLVPGLLCSPRLYAEQLPALWRAGPVSVASHHLDASLAAITGRLLAAAPPRFALVGLSMGGYLAFEIMRQAGDRVTRLALLNTSARPDTAQQAQRRREQIAMTRDGQFSEVVDILYRRWVRAERRGDLALHQVVRQMAEETGPEAFIRQQTAIMNRPDSRAGLAAIGCPALVVAGADDDVTTPDHAAEIAGHIPRARLVVIPDCGHLSTLEQPAAVTHALDGWLTPLPAQLPAGGAVDVRGDPANMAVPGRQGPGWLEHQDGPARRGRLVLPALGNHEDITGVQLDGSLTAIWIAQRDVEPAVDHEEELVCLLVDVPDVLAPRVSDLDVVVVDAAEDARAVDVAEGGQCLGEADGRCCHAITCHAIIVRGPKARVLYAFDVDAEPSARCQVRAWAPRVPGIREVFHARLVDYAYPAHCHDTWAILIVDDGAIRYDLDRRRCAATGHTVTILPPGVAHDGGPAPGASGFRKRELYLEGTYFPAGLTGAAVDHTSISDPPLRAAISELHDCLVRGGAGLDAEARLALIGERINGHLSRWPSAAPSPEPGLAHRLRQYLDDHVTLQGGPPGPSLASAAAALDRSVPHLVRSFTRQFGLSPHAYLTGRRIDRARRLLLLGAAPADVATAVGFYDQAHLTRHFKRYTSATPSSYARSHPVRG
jgi:pimeloyl-ACP methyl ester carboxylesterase/AraC-like DNA-binding protein